MRTLLLLIIPALMYAQSLKSLLEYAHTHNTLILSKDLNRQAKEHDVQAQRRAYYPTLDAGAFYQSLNERNSMQPGDTYSAYAKVGFDIYDGGKKFSLLQQKKYELHASAFDADAAKKSLSLQIVETFFSLKSLHATFASLKEANSSLKAQLERVTQFYKAALATQDDIDRLQSAYDTNLYDIASVQYQILSAQSALEFIVGKKIENIDDAAFKALSIDDISPIDSTRALMAQEEALSHSAASIQSIYYPQIRAEDTYSFYDYGRSDALHLEGVTHQNKLMLTLNLRVFDNSSIEKSRQAVMTQALALHEQIVYVTQEQQMQYTLAQSAIETGKQKIQSAQSALKSAKSAFDTINEKYNAGIVDNIVYLDALSALTKADALYETSRNDLEVAYARYYYYAGKNIEEFLQ